MTARRPVLVVFGTRPDAIKLAPVIAALRGSTTLAPRVCVTGQHREMLDQMLRVFAIEPDHDLAVMQPVQDLSDITARVLLGLRGVLSAERPAAVLVQGDTTTTMAAALAAFYAGAPVGHVEAGLRTDRLDQPFPEEMNRRLVGQLATWHYAPTARAAEHLRREGVAADRILDQGLQRREQPRLSFDGALAPAARTSDGATQVIAPGLQVGKAAIDGATSHSSRRRHGRHAAMAQRQRLARHKQPAPALIQERPHLLIAGTNSVSVDHAESIQLPRPACWRSPDSILALFVPIRFLYFASDPKGAAQ